MIELEFRSIFTKEKYDNIKAFLDTSATSLGDDDKSCTYYVFPDRLLKIVHNVSKKNAKVSLKMNNIGNGPAFEEIEFYFSEGELETAKKLFQNLPLTAEVTAESQDRKNYVYKDCEIALKYSKTWGYHLEIEQVIKDLTQKDEAEKKIRLVAQELGIELMTEEELASFIKSHQKS